MAYSDPDAWKVWIQTDNPTIALAWSPFRSGHPTPRKWILDLKHKSAAQIITAIKGGAKQFLLNLGNEVEIPIRPLMLDNQIIFIEVRDS